MFKLTTCSCKNLKFQRSKVCRTLIFTVAMTNGSTWALSRLVVQCSLIWNTTSSESNAAQGSGSNSESVKPPFWNRPQNRTVLSHHYAVAGGVCWCVFFDFAASLNVCWCFFRVLVTYILCQTEFKWASQACYASVRSVQVWFPS